MVIAPIFIAIPFVLLYIPYEEFPFAVIVPVFVTAPILSLYIPYEEFPFNVIVPSPVTSSFPLFFIPILYVFLVLTEADTFNIPLFIIVDAKLLLVPVAEFVIIPVFPSELSIISRLPSVFVIGLKISIVYPFKSSTIFLFVATISFISVMFLNISIFVCVSGKIGSALGIFIVVVLLSSIVVPANFILFIITWSSPVLPLPFFL